MNKQQMIILIFSLIMLPFTILGGEKSSEGNSSKIALEGSFRTGSLRSGGDAISVEIQGNTILASFFKDLGNVQVTITNGMGVRVYESTLNTSEQQQAHIPLSGLPSGKYTITFSNNLGSMIGEFEI